ncbi:N-formylglutamate amidohydrolase [Rhodobaculum claviforme]|uniref:N-formylglutamate amidohydrolase n=1 Tax=Rhodobaculum claviforme TaxID=1549854 RepID=A0A934WIF1_9RHOB|nr:N-formylglutamate amidohydrolase [Rhodobaculum claviforme]MBK5926702.1 N-formylglutamate amidohydrolase [Rhodobaculum claviforme]
MSGCVYDLLRPAVLRSSVVFASPHSGRDYRPEFLMRTALDPLALRSSEDAFVDRLFGCAPQLGATLLTARLPRAWLDLNRSPEELDPLLIEGVTRGVPSPRISAGLGVVPRVVAGGRAIYRGRLSMAEAQARIDTTWRPYHDGLRAVLEDIRARFGRAILIDCHSMPREAISMSLRGARGLPQVVLGDRFGNSAGPDVVDRVEAAFARAGLRVVRNTPFAGAYMAEHYGRPAEGIHVVQVEIDRGLYMDEGRVAPLPAFATLQRLLRGVVAEIAAIDDVPEVPLAAE